MLGFTVCAGLSAQKVTIYKPPDESAESQESPKSIGQHEVSPLDSIAIGPKGEGQNIDLMMTPPDGRWLVDDDGTEYVISRFPKLEGLYRWVDEEAGTVRLGRLLPLQVIDHDAENLYFRFERPPSYEEIVEKATAEQTAAVEASYQMEIEEVDRVHLTWWGEGLPREGQWRNGFDIADMNGDGNLDLVHPPPRKSFSPPTILLGDGSGHWSPWSDLSFPPLPYDYGDVAAADFNGDGHQDMALTMHLTGIVVLAGDGKGGFTVWSRDLPMRNDAWKRQPGLPSTRNWRGSPANVDNPANRNKPPIGESPMMSVEEAGVDGFSGRAIETLDWNADGRPDLLVLSEGPTSLDDLSTGRVPPMGKVIFLNRGDGTWSVQTGPGAMLGDHIVSADLDQDGAIDFVTDSNMLGSAELVNYKDGESWVAQSLPDVRTKHLVHSIAVADFDQDGRLDIATGFRATELGVLRYGIELYFGQPEREWRREPVWAMEQGPTRGIEAMAAGDVDGDGDPDLVALPREGGVWMFLNDGKGHFVRDATPEADPDDDHYYCAGYNARLEDLDGDGAPELVAVFAGEPGSEKLLLGAIPERCRAFGSVQVWKFAQGPGPSGGIERSAAGESR